MMRRWLMGWFILGSSLGWPGVAGAQSHPDKRTEVTRSQEPGTAETRKNRQKRRRKDQTLVPPAEKHRDVEPARRPVRELEPTTSGALKVCVHDRRCRLDRLKRKSRARRRTTRVREEIILERLLERERQRAMVEIPRRDNPISISHRASLMGVYGLSAAYSLLAHVQLEGSYVYDTNNYLEYRSQDDFADGPLNLHWLTGAVTVLPLSGRITPTLSAIFLWGAGTYRQHAYGRHITFDPETGEPVEEEDRRLRIGAHYHVAGLAAGVDLQLHAGLRASLGVTYRWPIYVQARYGPGRYEKVIRKALEDWFHDSRRIDVVVRGGWAF